MRHSYSSSRPGGVIGLRLAGVLLSATVLAACGSGGGGQQGQSQGEGQGQGQQQQQPPVPVDAETVIPHSVDVMSEYPGRVEGRRTVQVRARVEGILERRFYNEGEVVDEGDALFKIDPKPFQAVVNQRKAELSRAQADLNQAQRNWARVRRLYDVDAVSEAERDTALSQLETSRASVQQAQANLEAAQIDLGYTSVNAPLTGVTSLRDVDEGALVSNGTQLTTITQLDPVQVLFALPEDDAIARRKALQAMGGQTTDARTREAIIVLPNGDEFPVKGEVDFTQSTINPDTGTVQLRAVVANTGNELMPGRYVRARIRLETRHNAIVVPNVAISDGQQQTQVFVVGEDGKAQPKTVQLGPNVEGGRIVESGLSGGEQVITSGLGQVRPGAPVKVNQNSDASSGNGGNGGPANGSGSGASNGNDDQPPGQSARRDDGANTGASVADVESRSLRLRLSPSEPLQHMQAQRPDAQAVQRYKTDNAFAANVGQGS